MLVTHGNGRKRGRDKLSAVTLFFKGGSTGNVKVVCRVLERVLEKDDKTCQRGKRIAVWK